MDNFKPRQENNPAARMMSLNEMKELFGILSKLKDDGDGNKTISELYEQIYLKLGKSINNDKKIPSDE